MQYRLQGLIENDTMMLKRHRHLAQMMTINICPRNALKIPTGICQFSQYLGTKLDMLFEMTSHNFRKTAILPKNC